MLGGALLAALLLATAAVAAPARFEDRYAVNDGVRLHYTAAGKGPLVVMLHGFPEYWGFYRGLMGELDGGYRVAAVDLRGYNLSDKPQGVEAYAFDKLIGDVAAVIKAEGRTSAIVIGHDWGAAIAWRVAMDRPELVDRLVIMSVPHPVGFARELATNPVQQKNSQYARNFQVPGFEKNLNPEMLTARAPAAIKAEWTEALKRTDFTAMLNYYRANYPKGVGDQIQPAPASTAPIKVPVLVIHGIKDAALLAAGHSGTWEHVEADTTILMIPSAGHDVQHDAEALVDRTIHQWLDLRR
ncbi:MAG: alpha/beta hydrolase [Phenylobacterium sp.]